MQQPSGIRRQSRDEEWTEVEHGPSSSNGIPQEANSIEIDGPAIESTMETETQGSPSSITGLQKAAKLIKISGERTLSSVAFLADGKHVVSGGTKGKIRCWRVEDGKEVGTPMNTGTIFNIAVSQDGKWIVSASAIGMTTYGQVTVWNPNSYKKVVTFKRFRGLVCGVDLSPDGTRIAIGSHEKTLLVWSLLTGKRLLGPLQHKNFMAVVKFSPDGRLIATTTSRSQDSVRIYDSQSGVLLVDYPLRVAPTTQTLAWSGDSKKLFTVSSKGNIKCLDVSTGTTLSWPVTIDNVRCISLASRSTVIAAATKSSVSFWDTTTYKQIGAVIEHPASITCMAISPMYDIVIGGGKDITLHNLCDALPSPYRDNMLRKRAILERNPGSLYRLDKSPEEKIAKLEKTAQGLCDELASSRNTANILVQVLRTHEQKHQCEDLYAEGQILDAATSLLEIMNTITEEARANTQITDWLTDFTHRCVLTLESTGDEALNAKKHDEALAAYSTALSLSQSTPNTIIIKWASTVLVDSTANEALGTVSKFKPPRFMVYQAICDVLEKDDRVTEAAECFQQMLNELSEDARAHDEQVRWQLDFRRRCVEKLEKLGDMAMNSEHHNTAIKQYSDALTLDPTNQFEIFLKRSNARTVMGSYEEALVDAAKAVELDPSSYKGYERKHAVLQRMERHGEALEAFEMMLSKLEQSPDPHVRGLRHQYVDATPVIRRVVEQTIRDMPRVLIDTTTGHLHDKERQKEAFEKLPIFDELRSSMTTRLDLARIQMEVKKYYQYVMFSHKWEYGEPLFQRVQDISIYELEASSPNIKLQTFCTLVRSLGFCWMWSDTCCIDKKDNVVLQESLVAMFTWYRGSSLTIVYLRGIWSESQKPGDLRESIWNTRAWTYQEYVAAEIIQFYTEDWKPYLGLDMFNHKKSPAILSEMQQVVAVSTQELAVLRPGLDRVREKLYLASRRQTTLVEDIAYSLLGILNVAISVIYGEGNRAVGRLLEHILTGSGDVTILAWTGRAGSYNSCLPPDLTVYDQLTPPHVPQPFETTERDSIVTALHSSLSDLSLAVKLYNHLNELASPTVAASRLRLPGIVFPVTELVHTSPSQSDANPDLHVYSATTSALGQVEIKTTEDLCGMEDCVLVHPWIGPLLDQEFSHDVTVFDDTTRALRLVARLRQPFGALLLAPLSRVQYKRVAADWLIMAQVREEVSLSELMESVRTVDVQ